MSLVHHHLIHQAHVGRTDISEDSVEILKQFLLDLASEIHMQVLIPPQLKFSRQQAWTGLVGIVTSHISFHYWTIEKYIQLDIYSCKDFDSVKTVSFLDKFWQSSDQKILLIDREPGKDFKIEKIY